MQLYMQAVTAIIMAAQSHFASSAPHLLCASELAHAVCVRVM